MDSPPPYYPPSYQEAIGNLEPSNMTRFGRLSTFFFDHFLQPSQLRRIFPRNVISCWWCVLILTVVQARHLLSPLPEIVRFVFLAIYTILGVVALGKFKRILQLFQYLFILPTILAVSVCIGSIPLFYFVNEDAHEILSLCFIQSLAMAIAFSVQFSLMDDVIKDIKGNQLVGQMLSPSNLPTV